MRWLAVLALVLLMAPVAPVAQAGSGAPARSRAARSRKPSLRRPAPRTLRPKASYLRALRRASRVLSKRRAIARLDPKLPTLVIPDVHARTEFLASVLASKDPASGRSYRQLLSTGKVQVVVVGDAMHAEARAENRWAQAQNQPLGPAMKAEVAESLGTMKQIMELKAAYPDHFHYLKGNHDNILDRNHAGDYSMVKYTDAGEAKLVKDYIAAKFGKDFLREYAAFERSLPIMAVGGKLAVSHSAPNRALAPDVIRRRSGQVIENYTWTDLTHDTPRQARIVKRQLEKLGLPADAIYVAGHRDTGARRYRRQGQLIQVNSDERLMFTVVPADRKFSPRTDVREAAPIR